MRSLAGTFEAIARRGDGVHGRLSIAALPSAVCTLLPPALRAFRERYPGIEVAVRDALQDRTMTMLEDGSVDLVIAGRPAGQSACIFEEIASDRLKLVVARRHPLSALLAEHEAALAAGLTMIVANLEGQILANLRRWDDVRERVLRTSEACRTIWSTRSEQGAAPK